MPDELKPLLRTLVVLHLRAVRTQGKDAWRLEFQRYLANRLNDPTSGQKAYYEGKQRDAKRHAHWAGQMFTAMSLLAVLATGIKLGLKLLGEAPASGLSDTLAIAAVLLPVVAVGVLSFAAALDMEARSHTFAQMHQFVERQARQMAGASSADEAAAHVATTESRLLGETVTWYSRRAYTSIA
jgi:hypothetical protein